MTMFSVERNRKLAPAPMLVMGRAIIGLTAVHYVRLNVCYASG